jgi:prephenate dehydrogenase
MKVAILGLGLVGGSLGLALKGRGVRVVGVERRELLEHAAVLAVADELVDTADDGAVRAAYADVDMVVLAAPIQAILHELPRAVASARAVTDVGSTKRAIAGASSARHFVPGHPMAGGSSAGAENARRDLFQGRPWLLCPDGRDEDALGLVSELIGLVGADIVHLDADAHDRLVAVTSHAPQLLASLLVVLAERRRALAIAGAGFFATTQTAGGNPAIWRDILATNGDRIAEVLDELGRELDAVRRALASGDPATGITLIADARRIRSGTPRGSG